MLLQKYVSGIAVVENPLKGVDVATSRWDGLAPAVLIRVPKKTPLELVGTFASGRSRERP